MVFYSRFYHQTLLRDTSVVLVFLMKKTSRVCVCCNNLYLIFSCTPTRCSYIRHIVTSLITLNVNIKPTLWAPWNILVHIKFVSTKVFQHLVICLIFVGLMSQTARDNVASSMRHNMYISSLWKRMRTLKGMFNGFKYWLPTDK